MSARAAIDLGVNFLDTAEVYGTEEIVGAAVRSYDRNKLAHSMTKPWQIDILPPQHMGADRMSTQFIVDGPRRIPFYKGKGGRTITDENVKTFWARNAEIGKRRGCYVFGIRAGGGFTPGYVGQAAKSFKQEAFTHHKLSRYQQFLADRLKGTPIIFFIVAPKKSGATNTSHIGQLEDFLLQAGVAANPHLMNIRGTKLEEWSIAGVIRGGGGKPSQSAKDFRSIMKI